MKRKSFGPPQIMLIAVLLLALFLVSKIVTPAPEGPPKLPSPTQASAQMPPIPRPKPMPHTPTKSEASKHIVAPKTNPNAIDTTNAFFHTHSMGNAGLKQMDSEMSHAPAAPPSNIKPAANPSGAQ